MGLTSVTIRHHLETLLVLGLVGEPTRRLKDGPGRPEMVYALTAKAAKRLPRNFGELCTHLVEALSTRLPRSRLDQILLEAGRRMGAQAGPESPARLEDRLDPAQSFLEARGYLSAWSQDEVGFRFTFANCPYMEVARERPAICRFDQGLLEALLNTRIELMGTIADARPVCTLLVLD